VEITDIEIGSGCSSGLCGYPASYRRACGCRRHCQHGIRCLRGWLCGDPVAHHADHGDTRDDYRQSCSSACAGHFRPQVVKLTGNEDSVAVFYEYQNPGQAMHMAQLFTPRANASRMSCRLLMAGCSPDETRPTAGPLRCFARRAWPSQKSTALLDK